MRRRRRTLNKLEEGETGSFFIFETAKETHMLQGIITTGRVLMYEKQEQEKEYLSKIQDEAHRWITRFELEDQMETCETIGAELSEEAKVLYFINNLIDSIFRDAKDNIMDLITRAFFLQTYEEISSSV